MYCTNIPILNPSKILAFQNKVEEVQNCMNQWCRHIYWNSLGQGLTSKDSLKKFLAHYDLIEYKWVYPGKEYNAVKYFQILWDKGVLQKENGVY